MSHWSHSSFILVERNGTSTIEIYEAESLEEVREFLEVKGGAVADD